MIAIAFRADARIAERLGVAASAQDAAIGDDLKDISKEFMALQNDRHIAGLRQFEGLVIHRSGECNRQSASLVPQMVGARQNSSGDGLPAGHARRKMMELAAVTQN